jgi:hypothetical protein
VVDRGSAAIEADGSVTLRLKRLKRALCRPPRRPGVDYADYADCSPRTGPAHYATHDIALFVQSRVGRQRYASALKQPQPTAAARVWNHVR